MVIAVDLDLLQRSGVLGAASVLQLGQSKHLHVYECMTVWQTQAS